MATILNDAAYMALPMNIKRGNPIPLDTTAVWYNKTELENYAKTGATAYVGQVLTLVAGGKCEAYMISNEAGTLVKLAQTTASGDLASDVANLQTQVEGLVEKVGAAAAEGTEASGLYKLIADVEAVAKARLESVEAGDNSVIIAGSATKPSVAVKVAISAAAGNALALDTDGLKVTIPAAAEYSIVKDANAVDGYAATYRLTKGGENVGAAINIPKDMVVKTGSVEINPEGKDAGTYLVLVLANATEDKIYIPVNSLIEYVTSGSSVGDMVVVAVDEITHKVTATITDGTITKEKLHADVQTSLNKANSAIQIADLAPYAKSADVESAYVKKNGSDRLITEAEGTKLSGIAEGAQVNVIESIKVNDVAQAVDGKAVNIAVPVADDTSIAINENKIGIKAVDVQKLFVAEGDVLIIDGGKA